MTGTRWTVRGKSIASRAQEIRLLAAQSVVFIYEFIVATQLIGHPGQVSAIRTLTILTVVFILVALLGPGN